MEGGDAVEKAGAAGLTTVRRRPELSTETTALLEDTLNRAARAAFARAPSATTGMVGMHAAFRHAEARALVAEDSTAGDSAGADSTAAVVAGVTSRSRDALG